MNGKQRLLIAIVLLGACGAALRAQDPDLQPELKAELDDNYQKSQALKLKRKWAEALPFSERTAELAPKVFGPDHINTGSIINGLGVNYASLGRRKEAVKAFRDALAIREKHSKESPLQFAVTMGNLAMELSNIGQLEEAEKLLKRSAEIENENLPANHPDRLLRLQDLGQLYAKMGRPRDGEALWVKRLELQEGTLDPKHPDIGRTLVNLTQTCWRNGNLADAELYARRTVRFAEAASDQAFLGRAYELLGNVCRECTKYEDASTAYRKCIAIRETLHGKDHPQVAVALTKLAECIMGARSGAEPETLLRRSLAIQEKSDKSEVNETLRVLAVWHLGLGQTDEAEKYARQSIDALEEQLGKDHFRIGAACQWLGIMQYTRGRLKEAEKSFRRGLAIVERTVGSDDPTAAAFLNDLARICARTNRLPEAIALQTRCLEITRKRLPPFHDAQITTEHNLGNFVLQSGKIDEAKAIYERSLKRAEAAKDSNGISQNLKRLAHVDMMLGKPHEAIAKQERVLEFDQKGLRNVFGFGSEATMFTFLETRSGVLPTLISMSRVAANSEPDAPESAAAQEAACTWTLRLQGIVFDTICRYRQAQQLSPDPEFQKRLADYRKLKRRVADAALNPERSKESLVDHEALERLEADLNRTLSVKDGSTDDVAVTAASIRAKLPPKSALALYVVVTPRLFNNDRWGPQRLMAFVVTPNQKSARLVDLGLMSAVDADVEALRKEFDDFQDKLKDCDTAKEAQDLEKTQEPIFRKKSAALYARVVGPLAKELGDAELLCLVTDGSLNRAPFEALVDDTGKYLAESRRCVYLSSGRDLLRPDETLARGAAVFAGPDFKVSGAEREVVAEKLLGKKELVASRGVRMAGRGVDVRSAGWKPLPGAEAEAGDIRGILSGTKFGPVKTYTGAEAMEEVLKSLSPPRILHLATHGFFLDRQKDGDDAGEGGNAGAGAARARLKKQDNPLLRSGVVLAGANTVGDESSKGDDGWVTAEEIALLDLHGTELVVLSACQTGLGEVKSGEGVFGLRRAFLHAGARSLLTSLFEVPDTETRELMQRFYQGLKAGQSKSASLNSAQRAMIDRRRQSHGAAHPFYWASFVLIGDPR